MAGIGLAGGYGAQAGALALKEILEERVKAKQQEFENQRRQEEFQRQQALRERGQGFEETQWNDLADQRGATLEGTRAATAGTEASTEGRRADTAAQLFENGVNVEDRGRTLRLRSIADSAMDGAPTPAGRLPLRAIAAINETSGVNLTTPGGDVAAYGPGATALQAWKGGERQIAQEQGEIDSRVAASNAQARADARAPQGLSPNQEMLAINRLQKQWSDATANYSEMKRQSEIMRDGLQAARNGDMAAGSQAVLVTFQKILDPTSVVRESEYARSASGQSVMNQMEGFLERLARGGAGVPVPELERFAALADKFVQNAGSGLEGRRARLSRTANYYGLEPSLIFDDADLSAPDEAPASAPAIPSGMPAPMRSSGGATSGGGWRRVR